MGVLMGFKGVLREAYGCIKGVMGVLKAYGCIKRVMGVLRGVYGCIRGFMGILRGFHGLKLLERLNIYENMIKLNPCWEKHKPSSHSFQPTFPSQGK